jgi:acyl-CoA thioesterase I
MPDHDGDRKYNITIIGDSLSSGFNMASGVFAVGRSADGSYRYSDYLAPMLAEKGWNVEINNRSIPGMMSSYGPSVAADIAKAPNKPDLVVLALGANDLLSKGDPEVMRQNLEKTITTLKAQGVEVMLAGMQADKGQDPAYREKYNQVFADLAKKYNLVTDPLFISGMVKNADGRTLAEIFKDGVTNDGHHPNAAGARLIAGGILPEIEEALKRVEQRTTAPPAPAIVTTQPTPSPAQQPT